MKYCGKCKTEKAPTLFSKNNTKWDGLDSSCKQCRSQYGRNHYAKNKSYYAKKARKHDVGARRKIKLLYHTIKASAACLDCGVKYPGEPWLMEYDHVRGEKKKSVSQSISTKRALLTEIEKCDLVCLICHRRRTAARGGWKVLTEGM